MDHYAQALPTPTSVRRAPPRAHDDGSSARAITGGGQQRSQMGALAKGLGWFSIGLGLAEIFAPRQLGRAIGAGDDHTTLLPLLGVREIASGLGILAQTESSSAWLKSRVLGDAMDLSLLAAAFAAPGASRSRLAVATAAVAGVTALDVLCSVQSTGSSLASQRQVTRSIVIQRPAAELYASWRQFDKLPQLFTHLESVRSLDDGRRSHWTSAPVAGKRYEWDSELTQDIPNECIAWHSLPGSQISMDGEVRFEDLGERRGSLVSVRLDYAPPAGKLGVGVAKLLGESPEQEVSRALRRWKQLLETGEIATTDGQSSGRRSPLSRLLP